MTLWRTLASKWLRPGTSALRSHNTSWPATPICRRTLLTTAHDIGPSHPPLLEQTVPEHFAGIVSQHG